MRLLLVTDSHWPVYSLTENLDEDPSGTVVELRPSEMVAYRMAVRDYQLWQQRMADPAWVAAHQQGEPAP